MTSIDVMSMVTRLQALESTMSSLGTQMGNAAQSGSFDEVLADASNAMVEASSALDPDSQDLASSAAGASSSYGAEPSGSEVVADARQYLGVPYQWGGTSPTTGFDCSGFVQHVYGDLGIALPRTSQEQANVGTPVPNLASAQPGDLLFFEPGPGGPGHVGIYVGGGMMIDAPHTGSSVQVEQVWGTPVEIRRILPSESEFTSGGVGSGTIDATDGAGAYGSIPASLGVPDGLVGAFAAAGQQYGVPPSLLAAVAKQESGFDPGAVSSAGAEGLMQIMPGTAAGLGIDPMDPSQAIDGAAQLLSGYLQQYGGSVPLALAAYNAGPGAVSEYGGVPPYSETQAYVQDIMSMLGATG